jgi:hypothetical protein
MGEPPSAVAGAAAVRPQRATSGAAAAAHARLVSELMPPAAPQLLSELSDDSERQAAGLNVDDWAHEADGSEWVPEGGLWGEQMEPESPPPPVERASGRRLLPSPPSAGLGVGAAVAGGSAVMMEQAPVGGSSGFVSKVSGVAAAPGAAPVEALPVFAVRKDAVEDGRASQGQQQRKTLEPVPVHFLTAEILAWHTEQQARNYQEPMHAYRNQGGLRHAGATMKPSGGAGFEKGRAVDPRSKMHGLHGEEQGPIDDAERAAVGRRNCSWAAPPISGRLARGGAIFQSARRALSIRRNLSGRDYHDAVRRRPATVRVSAPNPKELASKTVDRSKMSKEEMARENEKLAREAARRAARRAATRAAAIKAAKEAEEAELIENERLAQEQLEADTMRVQQVARRAAVAREAAQAARRRRQPVFNVSDEHGHATRSRKESRIAGSDRGSTSPTQRSVGRDPPQSQRSLRSTGANAVLSEKGSTRSTPAGGWSGHGQQHHRRSRHHAHRSQSHRMSPSQSEASRMRSTKAMSERRHHHHHDNHPHHHHSRASSQQARGSPTSTAAEEKGGYTSLKPAPANSVTNTSNGASTDSSNASSGMQPQHQQQQQQHANNKNVPAPTGGRRGSGQILAESHHVPRTGHRANSKSLSVPSRLHISV